MCEVCRFVCGFGLDLAWSSHFKCAYEILKCAYGFSLKREKSGFEKHVLKDSCLLGNSRLSYYGFVASK